MTGPDMREPVAGAHPLIRLLHDLCVKNMMSRNELARRSGLAEATLQNWWDNSRAPGLQNVEAALEVFGYGVKASWIGLRAENAKFRAGSHAKMRCGEVAFVDRIEKRVMVGHTVRGGLPLEWNLAGERLPAGGDDPCDLVLHEFSTENG